MYWKNGCQIIPPHDDNIAACILQNLAPWKTYSTKHLHGNALVSDPWGDITTAYYTQMAASYCRYPTENQVSYNILSNQKATNVGLKSVLYDRRGVLI